MHTGAVFVALPNHNLFPYVHTIPLICYLQILWLQDFAKVFQEEPDVSSVLMDHLRIRKLRVISHQYRAFILSALVIITARQFLSLLDTTKSRTKVTIFQRGELTLCSVTLMAELFILLRNNSQLIEYHLLNLHGTILLFLLKRTFPLIVKGLVEGEKRDNFNILVYAPSLLDFKEIVEADSSQSTSLRFSKGAPLILDKPDNEAKVGRALATSCWAVCGVFVDAHIGEWLSDELFTRL